MNTQTKLGLSLLVLSAFAGCASTGRDFRTTTDAEREQLATCTKAWVKASLAKEPLQLKEDVIEPLPEGSSEAETMRHLSRNLAAMSRLQDEITAQLDSRIYQGAGVCMTRMGINPATMPGFTPAKQR